MNDFSQEITKILVTEKSDTDKVYSLNLLIQTSVSNAIVDLEKKKIGQYNDVCNELQKQVDRLKTIRF